MQEIVIGVDVGNNQNKTKNTICKSGLVEKETKPVSSKNLIEYNGRYYTYGLENNRDLSRSKLNDDLYRIMVLGSIAMEMKARDCGNEAEVILGLAIPIVEWNNIKTREKNELYFDYGYETFNFEGEEFKVNINKVFILPQGYIAVVPKMEGLTGEIAKETGEDNPEIHLLDLGGGTSDIMLIKDGQITETIGNIDEGGVNFLIPKCQEALEAEFETILTTSQIENLLIKFETNAKVDQDMLNIVFKVAYDHFEKVLAKLSNYGFKRDSSNIVFVGGGANIMSKIDEKYKEFDLRFYRFYGSIHETAKGIEETIVQSLEE
jgi:plasmid segregation protein ParM